MSITDELERLEKMRASGALSEAEYAQAKAHALAGGSSATGSAGTSSAPHNGFLHRLTLSASDRVIGGVCGGLGAHTGLPSWAWRVIFCATVFYFGVGLLFYILLWIFIPRDGATPAAPTGS
ncbi:MAG: PspC domain-containing protein [Steroidobacteraceae bacterium]